MNQIRGNNKSNLFGLILVLLSSVLLGIWAAKETIALRNILLVCGSLISIYYISIEFRYEKLKQDISLRKALPPILIMCCFFWVATHYFLFAIDHVTQLQELKSTWLRAFLASVVGIGAGLALRYHPGRLNLLWLGILVTFLILHYQYIPRVVEQNKLLVTDHDLYLFRLKIDTVLMGIILIAGHIGTLHDSINTIQHSWYGVRILWFINWLLSNVLVLWAFVYIVDSRNGIGLASILYCFWILITIHFFIQSKLQGKTINNFLLSLLASIALILILSFAYLQNSINKGWHNFFEDVKISMQIDRYSNWKNVQEMRYPKRSDGHEVTNNTYQRIAWATAGAMAIPQYPQGAGILAYPLSIHPNSLFEGHLGKLHMLVASHSGWVELGLSFGIPILALIFLTLVIIFYQAIEDQPLAQITILVFVIAIFVLYAVSEISVKHGIEILFFLLSLIIGLSYTKQRQNFIKN